MSKILLIDSDDKIRDHLQKSFEELGNEFEYSIPGDDGIEKFKEYGPDLVLLNYNHCKETSDKMFEQMLEFDSTACIVSMLSEEVTSEVHRMYLKGARSSIRIPDEIKTKKDVKYIMDQMFKVCEELRIDDCVGCWKNNKFISTIKFN